MIKINLLPVRAEKKKESIRQQIIIAALILVLNLVVIAIVHRGINSEIKAANKRIAETKDKIEKIKKVIGEVDQFKETKKDLEKKLKIIASLENNRLGPVLLLDQLSMAIPDRIWLSDMTQKGSKISVKGNALDTNNVAAFMDNLEKSEMFSGVQLKQTALKKVQDYSLVEFELTFNAQGVEIVVESEEEPQGAAAKGKAKKKN